MLTRFSRSVASTARCATSRKATALTAGSGAGAGSPERLSGQSQSKQNRRPARRSSGIDVSKAQYQEALNGIASSKAQLAEAEAAYVKAKLDYDRAQNSVREPQHDQS